MSVQVRAEAPVNPTEDEEKVQKALLNIFPDAKVEKKGSRLDGLVKLSLNGAGLDFLSTFRSLIRQERIRSVARRLMMSRTEGERVVIYLHKQAAFVGRVSFCEPVGESPLGPISIEITSSTPETVIDYLAAMPGQDGFQRFRET